VDRVPVRTSSIGEYMQAREGVRVYRLVKRALDIVFSCLLLVLTSPLFLLIALFIQFEGLGPVFFRQPRLGRGGNNFGVFKFRTLRRKATERDLSGAHMALTDSDHDITRIGAILRASGLNELPQLINILLGQMSFIGPRPAVLHHEQYYTKWHRRRLEVTPGVTGLAQVCGRNAIPWGWRVALDRYYVNHMSFWLDLQILLKTWVVLVRGMGIEGQHDMYFDFTPPPPEVLAEFKARGVFRCFLTAGGD